MAEPKQKWIRMVAPDGVVKDVHPADAANAAASMEEGGRGYTLDTPEQAKLREYQTNKGASVGESLKAVGEHAAGTLSFGGSDALLSQIPGYNEQRRMRDETYPISGGVGTVGSALVPLLGQASKIGTVAKIAGGPLTAVSRGSVALGRSVEGVLAGSAPSIGRRMLAKTAGGAVAGATEGATIGAGQALTESSIQDKALTAELLLARMGESGSVGSILGGGLGAAGQLFGLAGKGVKGAAKFVPGVGEIIGADAQALANSKALAALGFQRSDMKRIIKKFGPDAVNEMGSEAQRILEIGTPGAWGRAARYELAEGAERVAKVKSTLNEELRDIYGKLDDSGTKARVDSIVDRVDRELLAPLRNSLSGSDEAVVREIRREIKPLYQSLERADKFAGAARAVPAIEKRLGELGSMSARREYESLSTAARAMRSELQGVRDLYKTMGMHEAANRVRGLSKSLAAVEGTNGSNVFTNMERVRDAYNLLDDSVARATRENASPGVAYSQLWGLARKQAERVKNFTITRDPKEAAYRQYWGILKDELASQAERTGLGTQLNEVNQRLKRVIALDEVASQSASFAGNRSVSLTDTISGVGGAGMGAGVGGPLGAAVGGLVGGTVNRFMRSAAGDELLAVAANRYASLRRAVDTADSTASAISRELKSALKVVPAKQRAVGVAARLAGEFEGQRQLVIARNAEQERLLAELNDRTAEASDAAPELSGAITETAARGSALLTAEMPQALETGDVRDRVSTPDVPESEKSAWLRKLGVLREPTSVIKSMRDGELTSEQVDVLRKAYPALYGKMQTELLRHVEQNAINGNVPAYEQRAMASVFTGTPVDATYDPKMIRAFQQKHQERKNRTQPAPMPRPSLARASDIAKRKFSPVDQREI